MHCSRERLSAAVRFAGAQDTFTQASGVWSGKVSSARVQLNPGATNGAVGWYEDEVDEWIHNRIRVAHKAERGASVTAEAAGTA